MFCAVLRLRTNDYDQYYAIATSTIFFYDFLLTLADEVCHVFNSIFAAFIDPPVKDQIRLAREEIMGYVGKIACRAAPVDNPVVFGIFLAVRSAPWQTSSFLKGWHRTGTCRSDTNSGCCMVSGIATRPCHMKSCFSNLGTASFGASPRQTRVSYVFDCKIRLGTCY